MSRLESFIKNLCGKFNNDAQIKSEEDKGKIIHPKAKHINAVCNHKIRNLPKNFKGYFVIEESYYETERGKNILPHLFLFKLDKKNGSFYGESISDLGNSTIFILKERTEHGKLYVSEIFEKNGKMTFGFKDPIVYDKVFD